MTSRANFENAPHACTAAAVAACSSARENIPNVLHMTTPDWLLLASPVDSYAMVKTDLATYACTHTK